MYAQKSDEAGGEDEQTAEVHEPAYGEDGPACVVLSVSPRVRVVQEVIRFLLVHSQVRAP